MKIVKYRCQDCNAEYSSGSSAKQMHTRATGHHGWKRVTYEVADQPSKITYQPGYKPRP